MDDFEALAKALDPDFSTYDEPLTHVSGFQIPPLKTLTLKSRPLTSHALTFSCDAELAVAADDSIHVFLPEFPTPEGPTSTSTTTKSSSAPKDHGAQEAAERDPAGIAAAAAVADAQNSSKASRQQFYTYILRIPTSRKPDPRMNAALFAAQGLVAPTYDDDYGTSTGGGVAEDLFSAFEGVGSGTVTGYGASLNQVVAIEWSPAGLGRNLRAVLAVMLTSGALLVFGEGGGGGMVDLGARMRNFRDWRILWGVGANLPLPDAGSEDGAYLPKDKVRSFSWAKYLGSGQALMAYATDQEEVVVLSVQYYLPNQFDADSDAGSHVWEVEELARFDARGPHPSTNIMDPDYIPYTSAFSLKWSPWLHSDGSRTAVLAYCARNYVGFRRFTIPSDWARGAGVEVAVEEADLTGICTNLLSDAFVEWEEAIWNRDGQKSAEASSRHRSRLCPSRSRSTVRRARPRSLMTRVSATRHSLKTQPHSVQRILSQVSVNPIPFWSLPTLISALLGLIIHPPDISKQREAPTYSLIRLSATATNDNWFQQSTGDPSSPSVVEALPKWAEAISSTVKLSVPVAMLSRGVGAVGGDAESVASGEDSDSDDDDFDLPEDAGEQIHPHRVRMWGMTMSPAGGMSAVLVSQHSTQKPEKSVKTKVMFGGRSGAVAALPPLGDEMEVDVDENAGGGRNEGFWARQSTEAKMWDWMYAGGPAVPGTLGSGEGARAGDVLLRKRFEEVKKKQRCVFCQTTLTDEGKESICEKGHIFATGLAILAPGISRACAVCGLRCLVAKEVVKIAQEHLGPDAKVEASEEMCGGCGGKFVV
ncbi:hypothetical protein ColLi_00993 [Colletotrichum liriopes]|uniref:Gpi-anchor transamidase n=1 Tax=Colletotrichum liriopes TaxID=708192 RepID=A0AA37GC44_9PEZI|nr:hypothetical protein ColLi_00993 [Colletotrichum liriopes]